MRGDSIKLNNLSNTLGVEKKETGLGTKYNASIAIFFNK